MTGLSPETEYHFQVVVKYGATEIKGLDKTFTTLNIPPPLATTGSATGISATGATVEGTVNAKGQPTTYYFNYGLTSSYGAKTAEVSAGKGTTALGVSALLAELLPEYDLPLPAGRPQRRGHDPRRRPDVHDHATS